MRLGRKVDCKILSRTFEGANGYSEYQARWFDHPVYDFTSSEDEAAETEVEIADSEDDGEDDDEGEDEEN
jgi:hypothetical protein